MRRHSPQLGLAGKLRFIQHPGSNGTRACEYHQFIALVGAPRLPSEESEQRPKAHQLRLRQGQQCQADRQPQDGITKQRRRQKHSLCLPAPHYTPFWTNVFKKVEHHTVDMFRDTLSQISWST